jgi:hypothetical protein
MQQWNAQGIRTGLMALAGIFVGGLSNVLLERIIYRDTTRVGLSWMLTGMTIVAADLLCRFRATEPKGWTRFFAGMGSGAGGAVRAFPMWSIGTFALTLGLLHLLRII